MFNSPLPAGALPPDAPARIGDPPPRIPAAAWALAWSALAGQLLAVVHRGLQPVDEGAAISMVLGAVIITWFSAGVLTGRTVRLVIVWFLFVVAAVLSVVSLQQAGWDGVTGWPAVALATAIADLVFLAWFSTTDYYRWQRAHRHHRDARDAGPSLLPLLTIAAVVGLLGGVIEPAEPRHNVTVNL